MILRCQFGASDCVGTLVDLPKRRVVCAVLHGHGFSGRTDCMCRLSELLCVCAVLSYVCSDLVSMSVVYGPIVRVYRASECGFVWFFHMCSLSICVDECMYVVLLHVWFDCMCAVSFFEFLSFV